MRKTMYHAFVIVRSGFSESESNMGNDKSSVSSDTLGISNRKKPIYQVYQDNVRIGFHTSHSALPKFVVVGRWPRNFHYVYLTRDIFFYLFFFTIIHFSQDSSGMERLFLTPPCHFHPLHKHWDISWAITAWS